MRLKSVTITKARQDLYNLVDEALQTSEPIQITGKRGDTVLVSLEDWNAIQETLYLTSIPNMREDILAGMKTPIGDCVEDIGWDIS
jgi:antitoxin YefM